MKETKPKEERKAKVWTTIFQTAGYRCWHVEWGREDGPELPYSVIKRLSLKFLKEDNTGLDCLHSIIPSNYKERTVDAAIRLFINKKSIK